MTLSKPEPPPAHPPDVIDAYLDGLLEGEPLSEFQKRLENDAALRDEVELQRWIDRSIAGLFADDASKGRVLQRVQDALRAASAASATAPHAERPPAAKTLWLSRKGAAIAAILALGTISLWNGADMLGEFADDVRSYFAPPPPPRFGSYAAKAWRSMDRVYADATDTGFEPDWVCATDEIFADTFQRQLGQTLLFGDAPSSVAAPRIRLTGLSYTNTITKRTICVLARVSDQPVMVFVDELAKDQGQSLADGSPLHLFRGEVGGLVLYELSPLDQPHLLDLFFEPDAGAQ